MDPEEEVPLDSVRLAAERTATNRRYKGWSRWKKLICAGLAMLGALIAIVAIAAVVVPMLIKTKHESGLHG